MTADVRELLRRHNRMLHGCGVVSGCRVRAAEAEWTVEIEPGYALGPQGDEIVVDGGRVDLSAHRSRRGDTVYVAVAYPDETDGSRVCASCRVAVLKQLPANHVEADGAAGAGLPVPEAVLIVEDHRHGGDLVSTEVVKRTLRAGGAVHLVKKDRTA